MVHGMAVSVAPRAVVEGTVVGLLLGVLAARQGAGPGAAVLAAVTGVVLAVVSTLAHELGHVVAARRARLTVLGLRIEGLLGGAVERETAPDPRAEAAIALAGPAVTLRLAAAGGLMALLGDGTGALLGLGLAVVNVLALVGCVLPMSRSDVGRARAAARAWSGASGAGIG
jgi:Zn-dependent protease